MEKLLSIAIPSYNMEQYLGRCLDSLIIDDNELMDALDIIVVNDGSKDRTSEIAHQYAERYPNSIRVIDKENGHYGSCINAALEIANGKYFRILDADDWFDKDGLKELLPKLTTINTDVFFTPQCRHYGEEREEIFKLDQSLRNKTFSLMTKDLSMPVVFMHQLNYKTTFLREIGYRQTTGICYTDTEYMYYPMVQAKDIHFFDIVLYHYQLGRNGQSMSGAATARNRKHFIKLIDRQLHDQPSKTNAYGLEFYTQVVMCILVTLLLRCKLDKEDSEKVSKFLDTLKEKSSTELDKVYAIKSHGVPFIKLWHKHPTLFNFFYTPIRLYLQNRD